MNKIQFDIDVNKLDLLKTHLSNYLVKLGKENILFQAVRNNCRILVFPNGKVDISGTGAFAVAKDINYFLDNTFYSAYGLACEGLSDLFGPLVFCMGYFDQDNLALIDKLKIDINKKITDYQVKQLGPYLIKSIKHSIKVINAKDYNDTLDKNYKKEQILAHYAFDMSSKIANKESLIIIDSFTDSANFFSFNQNKKLLQGEFAFYDNATQSHFASYVSSIIARYYYIQKITEYNQKVDAFLIKGNSEYTKEQYLELKEKHPILINEIAKKNYL